MLDRAAKEECAEDERGSLSATQSGGVSDSEFGQSDGISESVMDNPELDGFGLDASDSDTSKITGLSRQQFGIGAAPFVDLTQYHQPGYSAGGAKAKMMLWWLVQAIAFPLSHHTAHRFRCQLLRAFGARIGQGVCIRPTARFTYPWNVEIGDYSWIGDDVVCYSLAPIRIGCHCVISQKSYLCTGSHDVSSPRFALTVGEVVIENGVWIATDCFVAPSVRIGANSVVGVRSTVLSTLPSGKICVGTPCKPIKPRPIN